MSGKYKHIEELLKEEILTYRRKGIEKLPTEQELCKRFMVSRQTVRTALSHLSADGLIEKRHGSGSYVTGLSEQEAENVIGILVADNQEYLYPQLLFHLEKQLLSHGFRLKVYLTKGRPAKEREILTSLLKYPLRGLFVEPCSNVLPNPNLSLYRALEKTTSLVFWGRPYPGLPSADFCRSDYVSGSELLTEYLLKQGHKKIAGIFRMDDLAGHEGFMGLQQTMIRKGLPLCEEQIRWYHSKEWFDLLLHRDLSFIHRLIPEVPSECSCVICQNDLIAFYLTQELQKKGYSIPHDITVTCFSDSIFEMQSYLNIPMVRPDLNKMYQSCADLMIRKIKGLPAVSPEIPWSVIF